MISNLSVSEKILVTLQSLKQDLQMLKDPHYLIGASALILTGIPIEKTSDIDLLTSDRDANTLQKAWASTLLSRYMPADQHRFRSNFQRFEFPLMEVEVMGRLEVFANNQWTQVVVSESVALPGSTLLIPTLHEQKRILLLFGREKDLERINMIDHYLSTPS